MLIARCMVIYFFISISVAATSLYSDIGYTSLHADKRNLKVGSIVTVLIYEQASASTSAGSNTDRDTSLSANLGLTDPLKNERGNLGFGTGFSGGGSINRQGKLIASVSVSVQEIFDSGEVAIKGQQLIQFNDEKQHIELKGRIRPEDVNADNTVLSTRIADATITYVGDGLLGRQQKPGMISRILGWFF